MAKKLGDFDMAVSAATGRSREAAEEAAWWEAVETILAEGEAGLTKDADKKYQLSWLLFVSPCCPAIDEDEDVLWLQNWFRTWARRKPDTKGVSK